MNKIFFSGLLFLSALSFLYAGEAIKIMPVGNSITAGEHYWEPDVPERTGYRKVLYEMLIEAGYNIDFVGSQNHGERLESDPDWYDWNNEAYPGWKISAIADALDNALIVYQPDILLVHVGTNKSDWDDKPNQVMDMLDMINDYSVVNDHPITVLLCKIIKRFYKENSEPTSIFNKAVADSVAARSEDKIKIILVDMENGAGLDYTDNPPDSNTNPPYEGGDMFGETYPGVAYDKFHPNDKGNTKMAVKFYEELVKELGKPTKVETDGMNQISQQFELYQNYPNPFNPTTKIRFSVPYETMIKMEIFNLLGQKVVTIIDEKKSAGDYSVEFKGDNFNSGMYVYKMISNDQIISRKMLLIK